MFSPCIRVRYLSQEIQLMNMDIFSAAIFLKLKMIFLLFCLSTLGAQSFSIQNGTFMARGIFLNNMCCLKTSHLSLENISLIEHQ